MRRALRQRVAFGAFALLAWLVAECSPAPPVASIEPSPRTALVDSPAPATSTPAPSRPSDFEIEQVDREFLDVFALTSSGQVLFWASGREVWRYTPGAVDAELLYESADGDLVHDIAATHDGYVVSELLGRPQGGWRVVHFAGEGAAAPVEIDRGVAERGAPPTLAIDARHIAWAGFDETSGSPQSFLRSADRTDPGSATTLLDVDIDVGLLWYPQLDGDALWYSDIEPDFEGTGGGDRFHIATFDLSNPSAEPVRFEGLDNAFQPAVTPEFLVWKTVEPGMSALNWGQVHALDRRSSERLTITSQANHASVGARFVVFEELFRSSLLLYDLATRSLVEVPDPRPGGRGTIGGTAVAGNLLGYSVAAGGSETVFWSFLPG